MPQLDIKAEGSLGAKWEKGIQKTETDSIPPNTSKEISKFRKKVLVACRGNGFFDVIDLSKSVSKRYKEKKKIFDEQLSKGEITEEKYQALMSELSDRVINGTV